MASLGIIINFIYLYLPDHEMYCVWIPLIPTPLYPRREKIIWSELESNPGPLASQSTSLTTRPFLLRLLRLAIQAILSSANLVSCSYLELL